MKNFFFSGVAILGLVSLLFVFFEIPTKGIVSKDIKSEESPRIYKERSAETYNKIKKHIKERKTLKQLKSSTGNYLSDIEELGPNINGQIAYGDGNVYGGYVYDLEIHGDTWVAATETGGAWISFTAGDLWDPIDDDWAFSKLETVLRDPLDLNRYYFGGPRGTGLFYWDSNGNTLGTDEELIEWTGTIDGEPNLNFTSVDQLINAPFSSDAFYLSGNASEQSFSTAVFRHQNGAFEKISSNSFILDFEVLYDGTILYLQRSPTFKSVEVVKITMNGNDFSEEIIATLNYDDDITLNKAQIAIDKSNPCNESTIFVSVNKSESGDNKPVKLFVSQDNGQTWDNIYTYQASAYLHTQAMEVNCYEPDKYQLALGFVSNRIFNIDLANDLVQATDVEIGHLDYHGFYFTEDDGLVAWNDGGIFTQKEIQTVPTFPMPLQSTHNAYLANFQAVDITLGSNGSFLFGSWHNGAWKYDNGFEYLISGDGFQSAYHPTNESIFYHSTQSGNTYRYPEQKYFGSPILPSGEDQIFKTKIFTHSSAPSALFYVGHGLQKLSNAETCNSCNWTNYALTGGILTNYTFDKDEDGPIFFTNGTSNLYFLNNINTSTYSTINVPGYTGSFSRNSALALDPNNPNTLYYLNDQIYKITVDPSLSNQSATPEIIDLPFGIDLDYYDLIISPNDPNHILLATEIGLYHSTDDGQNWTPELGIPAVEIWDLAISDDNELYLATYGRGLWKASLNTNDVVELNITAILEGPYDSTQDKMEHQLLDANLLPNAQPFNTDPYFYLGNETINSNNPLANNIVDWVIIELRTGTPSTSQTNTVMIAQKAAILLDNNQIVDPQDFSPVRFSNIDPNQDYYVLLRHRNHLDILSSNAVNSNNNVVDFTNINQVFGPEQVKSISNNQYALFAGDYNQDGVIQTTDYDLWKFDPALVNIYTTIDGNLDGIVQATDYDIWSLNKSKVGIPDIVLD